MLYSCLIQSSLLFGLLTDGVHSLTKQLTRIASVFTSLNKSVSLAIISETDLISLFVIFFPCLCHQTDGSVPNTLVIANCEVVKPRVAAAEHISQVITSFSTNMCSFPLYNEEIYCRIYYLVLMCSQFNEEARSPFVKKYKTIIHPGEV